MFTKCIYQQNEITDLKSFNKILGKIKNMIKLFDYIFSSGKINGCVLFKKISGKYHLLKKDLLECDMFLYNSVLKGKKIPNIKKKIMLIKYYKKNINIIEDYADHTMSGDTSTSIDILAVTNILLGVPMLVLTYYCINFRDTGLKPLPINNFVFFFVIICIFILLILFLRSRKLIETFHNFVFDIPNDKLLNEIFFDARGRITSVSI